MLSASLVFRCGGKSDSNESSGSSARGDSGAPAQGGSGAAAGAGGAGTGGVTSQGRSAGEPPNPQCTEANVPTDCPLPPSVCQDASSMAFYSDAHCVSGQCAYTLQVYRCPSSCSSGACNATTSVDPPPPDPRCLAGTAGSSGSGGQSSGAIPPRAGAGGFGGSSAMGGVGGAATGGVSGAGAMGGASGCDLPAPVCQDATTLVSYTEPRCENFQCTYTTNTLACAEGCSNGACQVAFTAPAPP